MDKSPQVAPRTIWANKSQLHYWIAQGSPFERYCTDILYLHRWSWHKFTYPAQYTRSDNNPHGPLKTPTTDTRPTIETHHTPSTKGQRSSLPILQTREFCQTRLLMPNKAHKWNHQQPHTEIYTCIHYTWAIPFRQFRYRHHYTQ